MAENNSIGLAELIEQVKQELLATSLNNEKDVPFLSVDSIELELQVIVKREGKAGIKIHVLEAGGGTGRDDVQKVKVTMSPLLSKEKLLEDYQNRHPGQMQKLADKSLGALFKNVDDGSSLGDQF
jgi:hypothetical protein